MFKNQNFKLKSFVLIFFILVITVSFLFLKIKQRYQERDFVDNNEPVPELIDRSLSAKHSSKMLKFDNLKEFNTFVENNVSDLSSNYDGFMKRTGVDLAFSDSLQAAPKAESSNEMAMTEGLDFSTTNIQVQGVDEADIVKTDGNYIYYVSGQNLYIISSYPAEETKIISQIKFDSNPIDIYVKGDSLVVFGNDFMARNDILYEKSLSYIMPMSSRVFLQVYNISDRLNPQKEKDIKMDGSYFNSRLIGDYLYFLVNNYNYYGGGLPRMIYQDKDVNFDCQSGLKCLSSEIYYFDDYYNSGFDLSSIVSFNISDFESEPQSHFYLLPSGQNLYVSRDNIYLTYTKYLNEHEIETDVLLEIVYPRLSENDRKVVDEIEAVSDNILSLSEKRNKVRRILDLYSSLLSAPEREVLQKELDDKMFQKYPNILDELEKTVVHKLAVFEGSVEPIFMAEVPGTVLNQFSMDESDGFFRIATTRNQTWSRFVEERSESYNNLYVLDSNLEITGKIRGLAEGERIYSVRFMGDKAYIVTFKQVDPLFSIDLKDPYNPKVLGELKIPGFSNYLHPYSNNVLIGFGKDAQENEDGRVTNGGLKLSLFDVSNDNPQELDSYIIGDSGSESIALYDHRAFLFSKEKNILIVPAVLREKTGDRSWGNVSFNGLLIFNIVDNKFVLQGQIAHADSGLFENYYSNSVKRSLFIKENLYSLSDNLIKINKLENLEEVLSFKLN
ncbi:MAG: beta-propeller domain-containing protein [Patescibacteria group bacterium]|nr:beta-propeller domain-containing protein [Patescibacteria group bacterium]